MLEMEDLQSSLTCQGLTVTTLKGKGRCLYTTKDFSPGDVIISQEPYVSVPNNSSIDSRCEVCFTSGKLKKCSACHVVRYCGSTCQISDWKLHRLECHALSALNLDRRKSLTPSIRLMVKLYLRRKLQNDKIIPTTTTDNYNLVEALVSHIADINEKQLVLYAQMANLVNLIIKWPDINIKEVSENFSKLACNAHTICDSELRPLGTGLYPVVSIINHSCLPNSVLVFEGRMAVVRAVQCIPKGSEVLISYIDSAGSTMARQKALREQYFFTCTCPCCTKVNQFDDVRESAVLEGYRCKDDGCSGFLLRDTDDKGFVCQECGLLRSKEDIVRIASELKLMADKAAMSLSKGCYVEAQSIYKMVEKLQINLCHPFSVNLMRTRENLLKIFVELKDWQEAIVYCKLTVPVYLRVYPPFHPLLGLQYYTWGKLEWFLGNTEDAVKALTKAVDVLRVTHGINIPFMKNLLTMWEEARAEASYKFSSKDDSRQLMPYV